MYIIKVGETKEFIVQLQMYGNVCNEVSCLYTFFDILTKCSFYMFLVSPTEESTIFGVTFIHNLHEKCQVCTLLLLFMYTHYFRILNRDFCLSLEAFTGLKILLLFIGCFGYSLMKRLEG